MKHTKQKSRIREEDGQSLVYTSLYDSWPRKWTRPILQFPGVDPHGCLLLLITTAHSSESEWTSTVTAATADATTFRFFAELSYFSRDCSIRVRTDISGDFPGPCRTACTCTSFFITWSTLPLWNTVMDHCTIIMSGCI